MLTKNLIKKKKKKIRTANDNIKSKVTQTQLFDSNQASGFSQAKGLKS